MFYSINSNKILIFVYIRTIMTEHKYDFSMIVDKSRTDFIKIKKGQTPLSHKRRIPPPFISHQSFKRLR